MQLLFLQPWLLDLSPFRNRRREDAVGGLEAGADVVPVYAKERVLGFLPGVKVVSISRICNRNGNGLSSSIRRFLYKTLRFFLA